MVHPSSSWPVTMGKRIGARAPPENPLSYPAGTQSARGSKDDPIVGFESAFPHRFESALSVEDGALPIALSGARAVVTWLSGEPLGLRVAITARSAPVWANGTLELVAILGVALSVSCLADATEARDGT